MLGCSQTWWSSQQRMKACLKTTSMFCSREKLIGLKAQFLCNFHFLMWLLLLMPYPLFGPAEYWVWLTNTVLLFSSIHCYPSKCGGWLSVLGSVASGGASSPSDDPSSCLSLWSTSRWICWHPSIPLNANIITPRKLLPLGALGLNAFNHPWTFWVRYVFPPPALVPLVLSKFLVEHVKGQLRL